MWDLPAAAYGGGHLDSDPMFTRAPSDYSGSDRRRTLRYVLIIAVVGYLLLTAAGTIWTDFLWFDSINYRDVWLRNWGMSLLLGAVGIAVSFGVLWLSLRLVDYFTPRWAPFDLTEEEELIERFREWIEPRVRQIRLLVTAGLAIVLGLTVATWRDDVFLFLNSQEFGEVEPIFDLDLGFYMFELSLFETAVDWLFNLLVLTTVVVAIAQYLNGGIRFDGRRISTNRGAKIHLSVMFALIALVRAVSYRLDMYELLLSNNAEGFSGPGYTDINARLPALRLLLIIALIAAVLFILNIFRDGWTLALVSVGSWVIVAIAAGAIYPAIIERVQVDPNRLARERPYLINNLDMTREAYQLEGVDVVPFPAANDLTAENIESNQLTIDNLRIWNTSVLPRTYQNFQELEPYYALSKVDTDRYLDEGIPRQVMIAVRELEEINLPRDDWQNIHLFYTHGFGAVVNEASVVQPDGQPNFLLKDVPPVASVPGLELLEPRVYFGETYQPGRPVIVKTGSEPQEIDIPLEQGTQFNEYQGEAGVVIDNFFKRLAFAFRYRDLNLLISSQIRSDSRVLVERNVKAIVDEVAPFLEADADPYPVIVDGRILWVLDMYTTSTRYPYSQPLETEAIDRLRITSSLTTDINYIRNSVKAVVDAQNGDATFYLFDPDDPVARVWSETYPGLFESADNMPDGIEQHLRYPQDLFRLQSYMYLEYHVTDEAQLFSGNDAWSLPGDPSTIDRAGNERLFGDLKPITNPTPLAQMLPYYLLTELPEEDELSYLLLQPFTPRDRRNMVGFLVADSTPGRYGRLIELRMPQGRLVDGTEQAGQRIEQDAEISQQLSLWRGEGSDVIKGDMLVVPVEESVVYFQPIFLEEDGGAFPEFRRIAVVYADRVEWAESINGALELVFGEADGEQPGDGDGETPPTGDQTIEELVAEASEAFGNADAALRRGDLAEYQRWVQEAQQIIAEIQTLLGDSASDTDALRRVLTG
jgi:uncharacterized membrane protein (UPF0182 family)